jgi:hypothetical protein
MYKLREEKKQALQETVWKRAAEGGWSLIYSSSFFVHVSYDFPSFLKAARSVVWKTSSVISTSFTHPNTSYITGSILL